MSKLVEVCNSCFRASCWQGEFYCDNYKTAGTTKVSVDTLRREKKESPHYWKRKLA